MENSEKNNAVIGISIGDINGIGPEVIIKCLKDNRIFNYITPVIYGSTKTISYYKKLLNLDDFIYGQFKRGEKISHKKVNVVNCWEETADIKLGESTVEAGKYALKSLEEACLDLKDGVLDAIVTAPINKSNIQQDSFNFPGHTEYLTSKFEASESLMMLTTDELRVGVVTGHIPLKDVASAITKEAISKKLKIMLKSLKNDFNISKPKVAVLGLNPHAGDNGLLGKEEDEIIGPAIKEFKNRGDLVFGPYSADGFFGSAEYRKFDGVLAMYHDQGLIPFKSISFESGVNFTAGLSIVRTSPDHGTAYGIAGKGIASATSMREAIYLAADIVKNRNHKAIMDEAKLKPADKVNR